LVLEACLGGTSTASTEYDTVSGSTVAVLKVNTGEGAFWERGQAALIKDGTNGYRIRCIDSIATDDLNMSFNVPVAPASGVNLGKCVLYKPASVGHPTLSLWHYIGNSGALQALAGGRVTSAAFSMTAGELINASYSLEGVGYFFDPIVVVAGSNLIQFNDGAPKTATIAVKAYKSPIELADAIATAFTAAAGATVTCVYSSTTGKFTLTKAAAVGITWLTGTDSIGATIGFTADDVAVTTTTSDSAVSFASPQSPSYDTSDPLVAKDNEVMLGLATEYACFSASTVSFTVNTPKANINSICAQSGVSGSVINSREVTISVSALLNQYQAVEFERFRVGTAVKFQYSFGSKSAGNWTAGKSGALYCPSATISAFTIADADGLAQIDIELNAFVNSTGDGEVYVSFV
jgi:hypothetical protein